MTSAFISGLTFKVGDGASPQVYSAIEEAISVSGVGLTNPLIDATNYDSTAKEYIAGLADGTEVTVECNYLPNATVQATLKTNTNAGTTTNIQVLITDGVTPKTFTFDVIPLSWVINPQVEDRNTLTFTMKITGSIIEA